MKSKPNEMTIGTRKFDIKNHTYVCGILNVTPDSFSDGGKYNDIDQALFHAQEMVQEGADIIDVGGESTRPGYTQISEQEEIERTAPVVEAIRKRIDIPISIDTYKSAVAKANVEAGADMVNDIWGLKKDAKMASFLAEAKIPCCLAHNREEAKYKHFRKEMKTDLKESLHIAKAAGIENQRIILDPGIGFGKTYEQNLDALLVLKELGELGYPILLAASRKSVIGLTLDLPIDQRVEGTIATTVLGVLQGVSFVRVHDVLENKRALLMTEAILGKSGL